MEGLKAPVPFYGFGMQYIRFAKEEPQLYRLYRRQILTGFSVSLCKAIKEIPGFTEGTFDRDVVFRSLVEK